MSRPTTRSELLAAAAAEFEKLHNLVESVPQADRELPGACENWSVKDLLAHLDAWHTMFLGWESIGSAGKRPDMPAEGYTWTQTPSLNAAIYERTAGDPWREVTQRLQISHEAVMDIIRGYTDEDLFTKKRYAWTGSTSVGAYAVSATSSHYAWAHKLIRTWLKARASDGQS